MASISSTIGSESPKSKSLLLQSSAGGWVGAVSERVNSSGREVALTARKVNCLLSQKACWFTWLVGLQLNRRWDGRVGRRTHPSCTTTFVSCAEQRGVLSCRSCCSTARAPRMCETPSREMLMRSLLSDSIVKGRKTSGNWIFFRISIFTLCVVVHVVDVNAILTFRGCTPRLSCSPPLASYHCRHLPCHHRWDCRTRGRAA
jgi:hypothetical protein